jgi:hypothetical protein
MTSISRYIRLLATVVALSASNLLLQGQAHQTGLFTVRDPSPDVPFGTKALGQNGSAGRILSLTMDPGGRTLYAAAEISGVWKSTDEAHSWKRVSKGLRNGATVGHASLALDGLNPKRLLYATGADDGRVGHPFGGLWVSVDAAESWHRVALCSGDSTVNSVIFASGRPYVATQCGTWTTSDANLAGHWTTMTWPEASGITELANGRDQTLFACAGNTVYRITDIGSTAFKQKSLTLGGGCTGLAPAPAVGDGALEAAVAAFTQPQNGNTEVAVLNFQTRRVTTLGFAAYSSSGGSGLPQVRVQHIRSAPATSSTAGVAYDVYAADACDWFAYKPPSSGERAGTWTKLESTGTQSAACGSSLHADSWDMAFAPDYDPPNGVCKAYASTDGGVYANTSTDKVASGGCILGWVLAQSGLHALNSFIMAGFATGAYGSGHPSLFLPTGDNDVWARYNEQDVWFSPNDGLGDAGQVLVDQVAVGPILLSRGDVYALSVGVVTATMPIPNIAPDPKNAPCTSPGDCTDVGGTFQFPGTGGIAMISTLPYEAGPFGGDIVAIMEVNAATGADDVVRCAGTPCTGSGTIWKRVSRKAPKAFDNGIAKVLAAGGHVAPVIYALTPRVSDGKDAPQIWRGTSIPGSNPPQVQWARANGTAATALSKPVNFFVNPYAATELYAVDAGDNTVKVSFDSGKSWKTDRTLTQFATNSQTGTGNAYRFDCNNSGSSFPYSPYRNGCAISGMAFDPLNPKIRVATSEFGGLAFSRDSGRDWMPLNVTNNVLSAESELTDEVSSAFYDGGYIEKDGHRFVPPNGPAIYAALHGHSLMSVAGPFPTLEEMTLIYPRSNVSSVTVSVAPLGVAVSLQKTSDGSFSGTVLFDSARFPKPGFIFLAKGMAPKSVWHVLTAEELASGVATTTCTACAGEDH